MMSLAKSCVVLGGIASLVLSVFMAGGYERSVHYQFLGDPQAHKDIVWTMALRGPGEHEYHNIMLPVAFQNQARPGDRLEKCGHWFNVLGVKAGVSEAFLWRDDQFVAPWREILVPFPLLVILLTLTPLLLAGFVSALFVLAKPKNNAGADLTNPTSGERKPIRNRLFLFGIAFLAILSVSIVSWFVGFGSEKDSAAVFMAVGQLKGAAREEEGFWTGDVAELYRRGRILRAVGQADAAPLRPLVDGPRPYHGYLFIAMDTGPSMTDLWDPVPLKGASKNKETFAICVYPAKEGPDKQVWMVCPVGIFRKTMDGGKPVLKWPQDIRNYESGWSIVD